MTATWPDDAARADVERLAATTNLLVALDFDGTLAPLVDQPMTARATPDAVDVVAALAALPDTTVAFVSGRSLKDLRVIAEHADDSPILLAGSHGAEFWVPGEGFVAVQDDADDQRLRDELRVEVADATAHLPGVWIEPKTFGFGVATRRASSSDAEAAVEIADALMHTRAPHWRRRTGHDIVEYSFRQEGKDSAVAAIRERTGATAALFAGDDTTDEDALRSLQPQDVGVRVGAADTSATVRVADIPGVVDLLRALRVARALTPGPRA